MPDFMMDKNQVEVIRKKYEEKLMLLPNVVGVGIGLKSPEDENDDQICIKVYVEKKLPKDILQQNEMIPSELDGIQIDVEEIGRVKAQE